MLRAEAVMKYKVPFIYCNLVGGNDELIFDGQSLVFDAPAISSPKAPPSTGGLAHHWTWRARLRHAASAQSD
jgi:predicted amidohydrolase